MRATEGLKVGCGGMGSRWLSRFKLIRLRRISLANLRRDGCEVWVDRWAGLQKLITDLDMRNGHKGGA